MKDPPVHEDTIGEKPARVKLLDNEQLELMRNHIEIIRALCCNYLTVKEIHQHFLVSQEGPSYSRALKTLYKDLSALEESELVKVVGYRKFKGSYQVEKLYSCTADVFFPRESVESQKWWLSNPGQLYLSRLSSLISEFFRVSKPIQPGVKKLLERFFELWDETVRELFKESEKSERLTEILSGIDINQIDDTTRFIGMLGAFFADPMLFKDLMTVIESSTNTT
ncbi:MAG: hypothetical protein ACFFDD_14985 [Promethearchaeota archaeon]